MRLSVVIPAYNAAEYIGETLKSVWAEGVPDGEVVVVDDGSTDGTLRTLREYGDRVRAFSQPNSEGCSSPRNRGIREARGRYIAFLDADDVVTDRRLWRQAEFLDRHPFVDFVFADFQNWDGLETQERHTRSCPRFRSLEKVPLEEDGFLIPRQAAYEALFFENFILPSTVMVRRELLDDVGVFDEALRSSEDIDFSFRVAKNRDVGFIDRVGLKRRLHQTNMSNNREKVLRYKVLAREKQWDVEKSGEAQAQLLKTLVGLRNSLAYVYRTEGKRREALSSALSTLVKLQMNTGSLRELSKTMVEMLIS
ncbi:MAG: glycosyltransferase [Elusimicrobia bacterium]|nr:glycosyltransferase [Elusimicrobiota bacterium]